jgi:hypothetical protein
MPPLPLPTTKQPRLPARHRRLTAVVSPSRRRRTVDAQLSSSHSAVRLLSSRSAAWCRLRAALRGGCLCGIRWRASLHGTAQASSSHGAAQALSSHGVAWAQKCGVVPMQRHTAVIFARRGVAASLHRPGVVVAWLLSSRAVARRLLSSHCRCCRGVVVCMVVVIVTACRRAIKGGGGTYLPAPLQTTAGAAQGQGINGATAIPLCWHGPCSRTNGEQGTKRGVPWAKRGASAFNRGRGRSEGSHTFRAPANGGGCAGVGRNAPVSARILFAHKQGAQKGAGAMQRKGVKGAAALPLCDSGANPIRAQTGGRVQKGGG